MSATSAVSMTVDAVWRVVAQYQQDRASPVALADDTIEVVGVPIDDPLGRSKRIELRWFVRQPEVPSVPTRTPIRAARFPKVLYVDYPEGSPTYKRGVRKHVALFDWTDEAQYVGATADQIGLAGAVRARNFWTDDTIVIPAEGWCELLPRRSARMSEITV